MRFTTLARRGGFAARFKRQLAFLASVLALLVSTLGLPVAQSTAGAASFKGSITIATVAPFTGVDAALGPKYETACYAASQAINKAGGVLGNQVKCKTVDTRGDPADAVPAVRQMYATTSNLALVIGCTSDEAATVVPVFGAHKTVSFCMTGQSEFDAVHFPYFFRLVPPDAADSVAMVQIAKRHGYKKIALAFGNDAGSQTFVQPAIAAIQKNGMSIVSNQTLDISATTFQTEAQAIVQAHPDAIMMEALGAAGVALLDEVYQANGNKMIPTIGTSAMIDPVFFSGVTSGPIGTQNFISNFNADNQTVNASGPAYPLYKKLVLAQAGKVSGVPSFPGLLTANGTVHLYDGINLAALAMTMAGSTQGAKYKADILKIAEGQPGAVNVSSYAAGVAALKAHKKIHYIGVGGSYSFDAYQTAFGPFEDDQFLADGTTVAVGGTLGYCSLTTCKAKP
ncbi:MAG: ABC transporter substrate-binding protein [Acidobacteriota bacterium]|nr:ABC transporter substrate-binding protein [Acidobacteriota bacterium]MDE3043584.1 ABC transporter substrate-binding protein [Acidobacteriota bacterium]MDE3222590.1 ABC transporter substrate-binding protein [Acidobacteriota bacterium]